MFTNSYTYLIGWSKLDRWYYGVRFAKGCHPSDLWVTYFTSSIRVKKFRNENGEPDVVMIRKIFENAYKARDWETRVLHKMNVINDERWLNKTNNKAIVHDEISIAKMKMTNSKKTDDEKFRINNLKSRPGNKNGMYNRNRSGKNNPMYGKHHSQETIQKISQMNKGKMAVKDVNGVIVGLVPVNHERVLSGEWININVGKILTENFKQIRSAEWKKRGIKPPSPKGMLWWNDGKTCKRSKACPGESFVRGRIGMNTKNISEHVKVRNDGCKWWTNGHDEKFTKNCPGISWKNGRISRVKKL